MNATELEALFDRLWPICRSLAGPGFRESLEILGEHVPWQRTTFASGSRVLDWIVPAEWEARAAWIKGPDGIKRCDFSQNNLHLLGYSQPIHERMDLEDLRPHLNTLPDIPDAIPYLTSYYQSRWGFCLSHEEYERLPAGEYEVFIDAEHTPGAVEVAEAILPGESSEEILLSSYLCHPSMASNELSGPLVLTALYQLVQAMPHRRYTYRFVMSAETIGALCFLAKSGDHLREKLKAGFVLTCVGDSGPFTYKRSRRGHAEVDRITEWVLNKQGINHKVIDFTPALGSDERQYCSPGFNLPVGSLMRTMYTEFYQYHTSLDNKDYVSFQAMVDTAAMYAQVLQAFEHNKTWRNLAPYGEPHLSRRGLSKSLGGLKTMGDRDTALWWLLNMSDGEHDLLSIADKSQCRLEDLTTVAQVLAESGIFEEVHG